MKRILSIDGGGIRGIIPALILAEIEKRTGKPISESFDLIAGTSAGAIIALGLTCANDSGVQARLSADKMAELFVEHGAKIFSRSAMKTISSFRGWADELYSSNGLTTVLKNYFQSCYFEKSLTKVLVPTYDIQNCEPVFFKSWREEYKTLASASIALAAAAAPTYFEPVELIVNSQPRTLIDGGVCVNSPAVSAYAEAMRIFPAEEVFMLSIGTGNTQKAGKIAYKRAKNWGKIGWSAHMLDIIFDGVTDTADYQMNQLLGDDYYRLQVELNKSSTNLDDASKKNITCLKKTAMDFIANNENIIDKICNRLRLNQSSAQICQETQKAAEY